MADSSQILEQILQAPASANRPVSYSFLVPNERGMQSALSLLQKQQPAIPHPPPIEFAIFVSATETFSQRNLNCSIASSLDRLKPVIAAAHAANCRVRAYISVVLGCPFEGAVLPSAVTTLATKLLSMGADEIDLGDTTGMGTAPTTMQLLSTLKAAGIRCEDLTMHFHDTYGMALINTAASLELGVTKFDASVAGLGGCPYSPGATGNVATEELLYFMRSLGLETGVDLDALAEVGEWISRVLGRTTESRVGRALSGKKGTLR
ncbi:hypothetical protein K3495_g2138 [Podosphaera aphanis]|nr:hypothetical protein K3495_g2138 [Podosphaera aphanis]